MSFENEMYLEEIESRLNSAVALLHGLCVAIDSNDDFSLAVVRNGIGGVLKLLEDSDQFKACAEGA